jgi:hypothetical protein
MHDRLDEFIHALEHYCLMNQPADLLSAIQYAKNELNNMDDEEQKEHDRIIDELGPF